MSFRADHFLTYKGEKTQAGEIFLDNMSGDDISNLFLEILNNGVHGFCFSLYEEGQKPGDVISEAQVRRRLEILRPHTKWVRSFSTTEGNELIPVIAREYGMKTLVGAWLGNETDKNSLEIENLIKLSNEGYVDIAAVGNEVLYRKDLSMDQLLQYIQEVKNQINGIPVGYVDAYYEFVQHPELVDSCDVILCNCYPFWEGTDFEHSLPHMQHMYGQVVANGKGKKVIITETGWPSQGESLGNALPTPMNALKYFINTQLWSLDESIEVFYFSSFDESWKVGAEGTVGAFWGVWDSKEKLKYTDMDNQH